MKNYVVLGLICLITLGCLDTEKELKAIETGAKVADGVGAIGVPGAGLVGMGLGLLAEFVRGRKEKKGIKEKRSLELGRMRNSMSIRIQNQ